MAIPLDAYDPKPVRQPGDFQRDAKGTPYVADPVKRRKDGQPWSVRYSRPSGLGKQIEDTYNLDKWNERQVVIGFAVSTDSPDLSHLLPIDQDSKPWKEAADKAVKTLKEAAKANLAAERGTHTHLTTELDDEGSNWLTRAEHGEQLGIPLDVQAELVAAWRAMLDDLGLVIVANEAAVVNDAWRCAGTLDRIARLTRDLEFIAATGEIVTLPAGTHLVLDIKTGKLTVDTNGYPRYWHSYAIQIAAYADSVPYDTDTDTRGEWGYTIDTGWAIIAHLDVLAALDGDPRCTPILVDLNAGRAAGNLCVAARDWQRRTDLFGHLKENPCDSEFTTSTTPAPLATSSAITSGTSTCPSSTSSLTPSSPTRSTNSPSTTATSGTSPTSSDSASGDEGSNYSPEETGRQALRDRVAMLNDAQAAAFRAHGFDKSTPTDVIAAALDEIDPFAHVAPIPEPPAPTPVTDPPPQHVDQERIDKLVEKVRASPVRGVVNGWIKEGNTAGYPWNPLVTRSVVDYERTRAALALAVACLGTDTTSTIDTPDPEARP